MEQNEIIEGNRLIAEYMGATLLAEDHNRVVFPNDAHPTRVTSLEYHYSWDWLMAVIDKIESLPAVGDTSGMKGAYKITIDPWNVDITDYSTEKEHRIVRISMDEGTKIGCLHSAVISFIKWYNSTK